jgi:hypothetical protein
MERIDWLKFRQTNGLNIEWLYEYYLQFMGESESPLPFPEFDIAMQRYIQMGNINKFILHYDNLHQITTLVDKGVVKYF